MRCRWVLFGEEGEAVMDLGVIFVLLKCVVVLTWPLTGCRSLRGRVGLELVGRQGSHCTSRPRTVPHHRRGRGGSRKSGPSRRTPLHRRLVASPQRRGTAPACKNRTTAAFNCVVVFLKSIDENMSFTIFWFLLRRVPKFFFFFSLKLCELLGSSVRDCEQ